MLSSATSRPEAVIGMIFSPARHYEMLEVVRGDVTSDIAIATAMGIGRSIGKTPVLADCLPWLRWKPNAVYARYRS